MTPKLQEALDCAARNGGKLTRSPAGIWRGADNDPLRFDSSVISALVKEKRMSYSAFLREGSKAGTEVTVQ